MTSAPTLFAPLTLRGVAVPNRMWISPMCQYSSVGGFPSDWHLVHLGGLARGGAGLVMSEATAVTADGRISPDDAGIWTDKHAEAYRRITGFVAGQGAVPGIQLAHAGRKASTFAPWRGHGSVPLDRGGWSTVGPSAIPFGDYATPVELSVDEIADVVAAFAAAAARAVEVGYQIIEIHGAHGYLVHEFLSPLSNHRTDGFGGAGRPQLLLDIADAVRDTIPDRVPLLVRLSASDWAPGGLDVDDVAGVAATLAGHGVDLIDVSSGGNAVEQQITLGPGYQVPFARVIREVSGLPVSAVGLITEPVQAQGYLTDGSADAIMLGRAALREPNWPQRAAAELGGEVRWASQYLRARLSPGS